MSIVLHHFITEIDNWS